MGRTPFVDKAPPPQSEPSQQTDQTADYGVNAIGIYLEDARDDKGCQHQHRDGDRGDRNDRPNEFNELLDSFQTAQHRFALFQPC